MLDPFDSELLAQELRDAWREIEHLKEDNKKLQDELDFYKDRSELDEERRWRDG